MNLDTGIQLIIAFLWGIYVYYTRETFLEIKKQTELNNNAYLIVEKDVSRDIEDDEGNNNIDKPIINLIPIKNRELYEKWERIVESNINVGSSRIYVILKLKNTGHCDIVDWKLTLNMNIKPSEYLENEVLIKKEDKTFIINSNDNTSVIEKGDYIKIAIAVVGSFPEVDLSWSIEYEDIREKKYKRFSGIKSSNHLNPLAHVSKEELENREEDDFSFLQ